MPGTNLQKLIKVNLLHGLHAIAGSELFRHLYVRNKTTGEEIDVVSDGELSCAFMVSSLLTLHGLIDHPHATVATTLAKMQEAGWYKVSQPQPGAVVEWPAKQEHAHIGFVINTTTCISNSEKHRVPITHPFVMPDGREPVAYYWHAVLEGEN